MQDYESSQENGKALWALSRFETGLEGVFQVYAKHAYRKVVVSDCFEEATTMPHQSNGKNA